MAPKYLFVCFLFFSATLLMASEGSWLLELGEEKQIELKEGEQLRLSQKNVVEVEALGGGHYKFIALHSGLVYVRVLDKEGRLLRSWVMEVLQRLHPEKTKVLQQEIWRQFFCEQPGISCDSDAAQVRGMTESLSWLHRARQQCLQLTPCRFEAQLSPAAQDLWSRRLQDEFALKNLRVQSDGFVRASIDCQGLTKGQQDHLVQEVKERYGAPLFLQCQSPSVLSYRLECVVVAHRQDQSLLDNPLHWDLRLLPKGATVQALLDGLSHSGQLSILARPRTRMLQGAELKLVDGGEMPIERQTRDGKELQWKPIGFQLTGKFMERTESLIRLRIDISLSRPQLASSNLASSSLQSEVFLPLGEWTELGTLQAQTEDSEKTAIPVLSDIPGLGALFQWHTEGLVRSDVRVILKVEELEQGGEQERSQEEGNSEKDPSQAP